VRGFGPLVLDAKAPQKRFLPGGQICHPGVEILQPRLETGFVVVALRGTFPGGGASGCHIIDPKKFRIIV
jgi:hypothetical protein